uniref:Formimidoyltransferase-cyclodeaminase n=1 Tax=Salmo trutta TaxID=8032 RepID=A0A674F5X7_SALTR
MAKLVECVPNFSEGRNKKVIDAIAEAISSTEGCSLLDVDPGSSTNRTVYTFVGSPRAVVEGALNAARTAFPLIDMTKHSGEHPRMGAMDVCPFIPVQNVTMEDCVNCANIFAQHLTDVLHVPVPVYLYGEAARKENRRSLPSVRAGEYEALSEKLKRTEWAPDYGPAAFVSSWGATVAGARKFLVAYNINLLSTKEQAHRIALDIREQGRSKDQVGTALLYKTLSLICLTPLLTSFIPSSPQDLNLPVVGSQIVGIMPLRAVLDCADFYIQRDRLFIVEEEHKVRLVISKLGLDSLGPFDPKERIIEYMVERTEEDKRLVSLSLQQFVRSVGARTAAPGGGSVSAAVAAMGAALGAMVGQMTYGKRQFDSLDSIMRRLIPPFHQAMNELLVMVDADSKAFSRYMAALKMPRNTSDEVKRREDAMQEGLKQAVAVPLSLAERVNLLWPCLKEMVLYGNVACKSDLQVAAKALETAVFGAYYNVVINLKDIADESFKVTTQQRASALLTEARESANAVLDAAERKE